MSRALYIVGGFFLVALVVGAGYYLRSRGGSTLPPGGEPLGNRYLPGTLPPGGSLPGANVNTIAPTDVSVSQKFGVLTKNRVAAFFIDSQNNILVVQPDGRVVQISNNTEVFLSDAEIQDLISASFSYDGTNALLVFGDPRAPQTSVFDVASKTWRPLPADVKGPVWSPATHEIAFLSSTSDELSVLATLDLRVPNAASRALLKIRGQDLVLAWPTYGRILVAEKSATLAEGSLFQFDTKTRVLNLIADGLPGAASAWNSTLTRGVLFTAGPAGYGGAFRLIDASGKSLNEFHIVTLPSKCTFWGSVSPPPATTTQEFVLCGFPKDGSAFLRNVLPDSYLERALFTDDYLFRIELATGAIENLLPTAEYALDVDQPKVFDNKLFFVNRYDERLYALALE